MNEMLEALIFLAEKFQKEGGRDGRWIAICLWTIHGAYNAGSGTLFRLKTICVEFASTFLDSKLSDKETP